MKKDIYLGVILALDTASKVTGWAVCKNDVLINSGAWKLKQGKEFADLLNKINAVIKKYNVTKIVAEDIFKDIDVKKQHAFEVLAECRGIVLCSSQLNNLPIAFISPIAVKTHVLGIRYKKMNQAEKQEARKRQKLAMINHVQKLGYKLNSSTDDEADAIGVWVAYLESSGYVITHPILHSRKRPTMP